MKFPIVLEPDRPARLFHAASVLRAGVRAAYSAPNALRQLLPTVTLVERDVTVVLPLVAIATNRT